MKNISTLAVAVLVAIACSSGFAADGNGTRSRVAYDGNTGSVRPVTVKRPVYWCPVGTGTWKPAIPVRRSPRYL